jgi:hypothetical protein
MKIILIILVGLLFTVSSFAQEKPSDFVKLD